MRRSSRKVAMMNKRLGALKRLEEAIGNLTIGLPLEAVLQKIVDLAAQLTQARCGALGVLDETTGKLGKFYVTGVDAETYAKIGRPPESMMLLGELLREGKTLRVKDISQHLKFSGFPPHHPVLSSFLGVPIRYRGLILGDLYVAKEGAEVFSGEDEASLTTFAIQAAAAIEYARTFERLQSSQATLQRLYEASVKVTTSLDLAETLHGITRAAVEGCGAASVNLILFDESGQIAQVAILDPSGALTPETLQVRQEGISRKVVETGQVWLLPDFSKEPPEGVNPALLRAGRKAAACLPLPFQAGKGVLWAHYNTPHPFAEEDLALLQTFVHQAAIAIQKAHLYEEVRLAALQLEAKVEDRTRELKMTNHRLEEVSRHKSEFLASMSHELRTPLNSIIGFSEVLQNQTFGPLNEKQARYVQNVLTSGRHLLTLINDLLDLSKIEAGKTDLRPETFDLPEALAAALSIIRPQADAKRLELKCEGEKVPSTITADPTRFKQILYNLLSNAVKFTPEGGTVTVSARPVCGPEGAPPPPPSPSEGEEAGRGCEGRGAEWVEISIADTGIGIKALDQGQLFQEFVQLASPLAEKHKGTGLGLTLTRKLVELHGGRIWVESKGEGKGSRFAFLLPVRAPGQKEDLG